MKNKLIAAILLSCFTTTTFTRAQELTKLPKIETPLGEIDPGEALSPMNKGQKAPFSGVLLSPKAVSKIVVDLKSIDDKVKIEVENAVKIEKALCLREENNRSIKTEADKKILLARIDEKIKTIVLYEDQLKREASKPDAGTLVAIGAAAGAVLTVLTVLAVSQVSK